MHEVTLFGWGADWWVAGATGLLAIFTAGLWAATYLLSKRAEKSLRHVERAYVSGGCGRLPPIKDNAGTRIGTKAGATVQNYGKTTGYVDRVAVATLPMAGPIPDAPDYSQGKSVFVSNMLGPNSQVTTAEGAFIELMGEPKQLFYGKIDYRDIFGASHYFCFAYTLNPATGEHEPYDNEAWWQWDGRREARRWWWPWSRKTARGGIAMGVSAEDKVKRGPESWAYIYVTLGFLIAIEGTVIQMIKPWEWPWNVIAFCGVGAFTVYLCLFCGWFQNKLIALKTSYENKFR